MKREQIRRLKQMALERNVNPISKEMIISCASHCQNTYLSLIRDVRAMEEEKYKAMMSHRVWCVEMSAKHFEIEMARMYQFINRPF